MTPESPGSVPREGAGSIAKAALLYFAVVFAAGFLLGTMRTLWIAPRLGTRVAELAETPVMLAVSLLAARWVVRKLAVPPRISARLAMGGLALALLVAAELALVLALRRVSIAEYFAARDPVAGTVYELSLLVFAVLPALVRRHSAR